MQTAALLDARHAFLLRQYIQSSQQNNFEVVSCEEPYNHFGQRGYIDLILKKYDELNKLCYWKLCELKPLILDIGETIRQINRAKQYFFKDRKELLQPGFSNIIRYPLILEATKANLAVCLNYLDLLKDVEIEFFSPDADLVQEITNNFQIQKEIIKIQKGS